MRNELQLWLPWMTDHGVEVAALSCFPKLLLVMLFIIATESQTVTEGKGSRRRIRGKRLPAVIAARNGIWEPSGSDRDDSDHKLLSLVGSEVSGIC